jgi:predicted CXXCH cytochrome family protein
LAKLEIKTVFAVTILFFVLSCKQDKYAPVTSNEVLGKQKAFVGSETCASCHAKEFEEWKGSHHDLSMQEADSVTVLGDFNNASFISKGITYTFFKKNKNFYVNTEGVGGKYDDYKVTHVFGVYPLQQYLIEFPDGKFQCLLAAWDSDENKWFHLQPNLEIHHEEWLHWTGGSMTWNNMCADCHSTNLQKNYDQTSLSYNTTYDIINVSCEACHGPSSTHVEYYSNIDKYNNLEAPKLYMTRGMDSKEVVQKCARCHSRRGQLTSYFDYSGHFLDHYVPSLLTDPIYELDGQIKDEVYVYGSFMQSRMYKEGVSCKDCHNSHSLSLKKTGNDLCLSCHTPDYNTYEHHFHNDLEATQCVNCHMTGKIYMGNDFRRDHSFRVPRPDQTVKYGTPNACNSCHEDKDAKWAANAIVKNYGPERPPHFSDDLLEAYHGEVDGFHKVFSNTDNPEIIRATALNRYGNNALTQDQLGKVLTYVNDISPLVRNEAILALNRSNQESVANAIKPLLMDSIRLVRISAANYFRANNEGVFLDEKNKQALNEYNNELQVNADFASGQHKIALDYQLKGNDDKAIEAYYRALEIDNYYNMSRVNLALLEYNKGNVAKAEELYLKVIEQEPEFSQPFYMLGLLYNELGQADKSLSYLKQACEKEPKIIRSFYNYALKLQEKQEFKASIKTIDEGLVYFANDENLLYVKLIALLRLNSNTEAYQLVNQLLKMSPNNPNYLSIKSRLEGK